MATEPTFTIGVEEEYLLVDRATRDLAADPSKKMLAEIEKRLTGQVSPEFLRAQIEVETRVCGSIAEAREDLGHLRRTVAGVANDFGYAPIAAATHPFASWRDQKQTDKERYNDLAKDLQAVARRLLIWTTRACGHRRRRPAHRFDGSSPVFPAAPVGAFHFVAVLAGRGNRVDELPAHGF